MSERRGGAGNFAENRERAVEAGRKGGQVSTGNFRFDPERSSEAGRKGRQDQPKGEGVANGIFVVPSGAGFRSLCARAVFRASQGTNDGLHTDRFLRLYLSGY